GDSNFMDSALNHAVLWSNGVKTDLGVLPGSSASIALSINGAGQVVGVSGQTVGIGHGFLWSNGQMLDLQTLLDSSGDGWQVYFPQSINDSGWIVGVGINPNGDTHGFLLTPVPEPSAIVL